MKSLLCLSLAVLSTQALSYDPESAYRDLETDYTVYEQRAAGQELHNASMAKVSPLGAARLYDPAKLPAVTSWKSIEVLQERFQYIRDLRFLSWRNGAFPRRSSWLYPDDGCYARAALAVQNLYRSFVPVPSKVFAFGNLRVKTANSPRGRVGWWYHVAPIVEVAGTKYVLDPAIEPKRPLELDEWLSRMGNPAKIKVSICSSGAYAPRSNCHTQTDGLERRAERAQSHFLNLEWKRLGRLGRSAETQLGDQPPWIGP